MLHISTIWSRSATRLDQGTGALERPGRSLCNDDADCEARRGGREAAIATHFEKMEPIMALFSRSISALIQSASPNQQMTHCSLDVHNASRFQVRNTQARPSRSRERAGARPDVGARRRNLAGWGGHTMGWALGSTIARPSPLAAETLIPMPVCARVLSGTRRAGMAGPTRPERPTPERITPLPPGA